MCTPHTGCDHAHMADDVNTLNCSNHIYSGQFDLTRACTAPTLAVCMLDSKGIHPCKQRSANQTTGRQVHSVTSGHMTQKIAFFVSMHDPIPSCQHCDFALVHSSLAASPFPNQSHDTQATGLHLTALAQLCPHQRRPPGMYSPWATGCSSPHHPRH